MASKQVITKSSLIASYEYDSSKYLLFITYQNGNEYTYHNVYPDVMSLVFDTPGSIGSKFIKHIRNGNYQASEGI